MKWLIVFDNNDQSNKHPKGWVLTEAYNFKIIFPKDIEIEYIIDWKGNWYSADIKNKENLVELRNVADKVDGIVVSLSLNSINRIINNQTKFSEIIKRLKDNKPLILCTGIHYIEMLEKLPFLKNRDYIFIKRQGIKWFNYHLKNEVKNFL